LLIARRKQRLVYTSKSRVFEDLSVSDHVKTTDKVNDGSQKANDRLEKSLVNQSHT